MRSAIFYLLMCLVITGCNIKDSEYERYELVRYNTDGTRLRLVKSFSTNNTNLLIIPGGPGMGSEYLIDLAKDLNTGGNVWLVDFPGNGDNPPDQANFNDWKRYLINLTTEFENTIILGHSFSGALILDTPYIEENVKGIILLNTPHKDFLNAFAEDMVKFNLPSFKLEKEAYKNNPSSVTFKQLNAAMADYFFTPAYKTKGKKLLERTNSNHHAFDWAHNEFWKQYKMENIPLSVPTIVIGGEYDHIAPHRVFVKDKNFKRPNIEIIEVKNSGHFAWVEHPNMIKSEIESFIKLVN